MNDKRFSMQDWKPEPLYDKLQRLEYKITEIDESKNPLKDRKKEIEIILTDYNVQLKTLSFGTIQYNDINSKRGQLVAEKSQIELKLSGIHSEFKKANAEREAIKLELRKKPNEAVKSALLEMRDRYLSFSADTTRVSSMRAMSSKFVEEIQTILKHIN